MPVLANKKHEQYAIYLYEGMTQYDAYIKAGFSPSHANASKLASKQNVKERVNELRNNQSLRQEQRMLSLRRDLEGDITRITDPEKMTNELLIDARLLFTRALEHGDFTPALKALQFTAELAGIQKDTRKRKNAGSVDTPQTSNKRESQQALLAIDNALSKSRDITNVEDIVAEDVTEDPGEDV